MVSLRKDGTVLAVLNAEQVLVKFESEVSAEFMTSGQKFVVFEEMPLPVSSGTLPMPSRIRVPKGRLELIALQEDPAFAILGVLAAPSPSRRRPPLADYLSPSGVYHGDSSSASREWTHSLLSSGESLGIVAGPIRSGDFVAME